MNFCEDRHEPKYQITYKPAKGCQQATGWLVCESCLSNKSCFGDKDQIQSMEILA